MKCPNCGLESPEGTDECPKCQLVFRKWQDRQVNKAVEEHAGLGKEEAKDTSSLTIRLFVMFLVCAGLYWLVRPSEKQAARAAAPETPAAAEQAVQQAQEAHEQAVAGPEESRWSFSGKVLDLVHGGPVLGAKVYFADPATGRNFSAETDFEGKYLLDAKPMEAGGYKVQIVHPDFDGRYWEGGSVRLPLKQRYQLAARPAAEQASYSGKPGADTAVDFAIFPNSLTAEEKKEQCAAAPKGPECSK